MRKILTAAAIFTCSMFAHADSAALSQPYKFIDMPVSEAASMLSASPNEANNLVVDTSGLHVLLESSDSTIDLVDIELRNQPTCKQSNAFNGTSILQSLEINPGDLELAINNIDTQVYYDHKRKVKIGIACAYDGAPLNVSLSRKQYMVLMGMTTP